MPKRGALLVLVSVGLLGGCSNENEEQAKRPAPKPQPKPLTLEVSSLTEKTTTNEAITLRGSVTPGAQVTVGRNAATVQDGRFRARVKLRVGVNRIRIVAQKTGYVTERKRVRIKRREPPPVVQPTQTPQDEEGGQPQQQQQQQQTPQQSSGDEFPCMSDPEFTCSRNGPPRFTGPPEPQDEGCPTGRNPSGECSGLGPGDTDPGEP